MKPPKKTIEKNQYDETIKFEYEVEAMITDKDRVNTFSARSENSKGDDVIVRLPNLGEKNKSYAIDLRRGNIVEIRIRLKPKRQTSF